LCISFSGDIPGDPGAAGIGGRAIELEFTRVTRALYVSSFAFFIIVSSTMEPEAPEEIMWPNSLTGRLKTSTPSISFKMSPTLTPAFAAGPSAVNDPTLTYVAG